MKKLTLLLIAMLGLQTLAMAQTKLYVYQIDGSRTEFLAANVDSISINDETSATDSDVNANGHEYVDLGLPSGTLWATCNVGANTPEEAGDHFAWGETETKDNYDLKTYKHSKSGDYRLEDLTKYTFPDNNIYADWYFEFNKFIGDNKTILDANDDVAKVNFGGDWRMPNKEEFEELIKECSWQFSYAISSPSRVGYTITSLKNGNTIFLPAAGYYEKADLKNHQTNGSYWCGTLSSNKSQEADAFVMTPSDVKMSNVLRTSGFTIRPVISKKNRYTMSFIGNGGTGSVNTVEVGHAGQFTLPINKFEREGYKFVGWNTKSDGTGIAYLEGDVSYSIDNDMEFYAQWYNMSSTGSENSYEFVDLGLSVKWATCNVGANTPEEYGRYFAWAEISSKENYEWETYKWGDSDKLSKYCIDSDMGTIDDKTRLENSDDAAYMNWGTNWRTPSKEEYEELLNKCVWKWAKLNNVQGYIVTSKINGNSIFLPAAGHRIGSVLTEALYGADYMTSDLSSLSMLAYSLHFCERGYLRFEEFHRMRGQVVRPVLP
jgi:hypothetical protein